MKRCRSFGRSLRPVAAMAVACIGATHALAQSNCRDQLFGVISAMRGSTVDLFRDTLHSVLEITSVPGEGSAPPTTMRVEMSTLGDRSLMSSPAFSQYADDRTVVLIREDERSVFIYDKPTAPPTDPAMSVPDSLLRIGQIAQCRKQVSNGAEVIKLVLEMPNDQRSMGIASVGYSFDPQRKVMLSSDVNYRAGHTLRSFAVKYISFERGAMDKRLSKPAIEQVMRGSKALGPFADFKFFDRRKKKTRHEGTN
jgi:hypothetical protein